MKIRTILAGSSLAAAILAGQLWAGTSDVADAAMNKNKAQVRTLIQQKADVNAAQADGTTALMWAVSTDDAELVDTLLKAGADPKIANRDGASPLYVACTNGNAAMVEKLLRAGADANAPLLVGGESALMVASRTGNPEAVKSLLDHGAKVNAAEPTHGTTALMWASEQNHADVIKVLAAAGADVNATAKFEKPFKQTGLTYNIKMDGKVGGLPAIAYAAREGAMDALKALVDAKADVNKQTGDLSPPCSFLFRTATTMWRATWWITGPTPISPTTRAGHRFTWPSSTAPWKPAASPCRTPIRRWTLLKCSSKSPSASTRASPSIPRSATGSAPPGSTSAALPHFYAQPFAATLK